MFALLLTISKTQALELTSKTLERGPCGHANKGVLFMMRFARWSGRVVGDERWTRGGL